MLSASLKYFLDFFTKEIRRILNRTKNLFTLELIAQLLEGVRGSERTPGEFRKSQNWISSSRYTLATTSFIPPPVLEMHEALNNLEIFLHDTTLLASFTITAAFVIFAGQYFCLGQTH